MKFDYCLGNPPYQNGNQQVYVDFYLAGRNIADSLSLIFPTGWQEPKNANNLSKLNNKEIKEDPQIVKIKNIRGAFPGVNGAENTNIILWKSNYNNGLNGLQRIIDEDNNENITKLLISKDEIEKPKVILSIVDKVNILKEDKIDTIISTRMQYGLPSDTLDNADKYKITLHENNFENAVRLFGRKKGEGRTFKYIDISHLNSKSTNLLNSYKLFLPKAWGNMDENVGLGGSYSNIICAYPLDCCTEMYIEVGPFNNIEECENAKKYFYTKFFRAVFYKQKTSQNTAKHNYIDIPIQNFTNNSDIDWSKTSHEIDLQLYKKYNFSNEEIDYIESNVSEKVEK